MRAPERFDGVIHEGIECPDMGERFDVVVIGPQDAEDTISVQASGQGVSMSFRFDRGQARRLGELLIASADDNAEVKW